MLTAIVLGSVLLAPLTEDPARITDLETYREVAAKIGREPGAHLKLALWCEAHGLEAEQWKHMALAALIFAVSWLTSVLLNLAGASPQVGSLMLAPVALLLTSVAYSTQYPIYRTVLDPSADVQDTPPATV